MMDCKAALVETGGDTEAAVELLRVRLGDKALKMGALSPRRTRSSSTAASASPPVSTRAALQSIMPAPVRSRSSLT